MQALTPLTFGHGHVKASLLGCLWGLGHSTGQLILGLMMVVLKDRFNSLVPALAKWGGTSVGLSLVCIGVMGLMELRGEAQAAQREQLSSQAGSLQAERSRLHSQPAFAAGGTLAISTTHGVVCAHVIWARRAHATSLLACSVCLLAGGAFVGESSVAPASSASAIASNGAAEKDFSIGTFITGILYGLQPDALFVIVPALTLPTKLAAAGYCLMFVLGTVGAMGGYTAVIGTHSAIHLVHDLWHGHGLVSNCIRSCWCFSEQFCASCRSLLQGYQRQEPVVDHKPECASISSCGRNWRNHVGI